MSDLLAILQPGDHLIYKPHSLAGYLIALKTWTKTAAHIEIYAGNGCSIASRHEGVNRYLLRREDLSMVLRPLDSFNFAKGMEYFESVKGEGYDYLGLAVFGLLTERGEEGKQICSEFATNWDRATGLVPFNRDWPAEKVAPAQFLQSPIFFQVRFPHLFAGTSADFSQ